MSGSRPGRARAVRIGLAAALLALVVLAWQGVASLHSVDDLTLASPVETFDALRDDWSLLMDNAGVTLVEVLLGLAISTIAGVSFAVAMHMFRPLRDAAYPLLVASQAIPVVVLAPIFVLAFDYGIGPKLAIVALICFFPITVNLLDGLRSVEPDLLKLMRSMGASRARTLPVVLPVKRSYSQPNRVRGQAPAEGRAWQDRMQPPPWCRSCPPATAWCSST